MPLIETQPNALSKTYATSLYELAEADGGAERAADVLEELESVLEAARGDERFGEFLSSRVLASEARDRSLVAIFEGRASELTLKFLRLLNAKGRLGHLPAIAASLDDLVQQAFGRVEVDVFTAAPMSEAERDVLKQKIAARLGSEVVLHAYVDAAMLGGVKIRIGDQLIDDSLATHLRRAKDRLLEDGVPRLRAQAGRAFDEGPGGAIPAG